jgi:hypothetical protein
MKRVHGLVAMGLVLSGALAVPACGGRAVLDNGGNGGDSGSPGDDGGIVTDSGIVIATDSGIIVVTDSGIVVVTDSGIVPLDSGIRDAHADQGAPDSGTVHDSGIVDSGHAADGGCASGFHLCGTTCADDTAPATCGTSCTPCQAPSNGVASCNGTSCSYTCDPGYNVCSTGCCSCGNVQTDPNNCGYCGHSCGTEACVDGVCGSTVVATNQANAYAIAADDVNVYWTTTGNASSVVQAPVAGGGATILWSSANDYPAALAVVSGQVYWTDEIMSGTVSRVPVGGGASIPVASNLSYPSALAASGG